VKVICDGLPLVQRLPVSVMESPKLKTALYVCAAAASAHDEQSSARVSAAAHP
jgi:hypothetical protein